jgi:hypothetical protein
MNMRSAEEDKKEDGLKILPQALQWPQKHLLSQQHEQQSAAAATAASNETRRPLAAPSSLLRISPDCYVW